MASKLALGIWRTRNLCALVDKRCSDFGDFRKLTPRPLDRQPRRNFGQPVAVTHPHLLDDGQLTPGISAAEYAHRRERLVNRIVDTQFFKRDNDHVIIVPGTNQKYMTKNIPYKFKQNTDFHYFTGFLEPDCCMVLLKLRGRCE